MWETALSTGLPQDGSSTDFLVVFTWRACGIFSTACCCCWSIIRHGMCLWFLNSTFPFTVHSLVLTHTLRMIGREKSNFPLALARLFRPQLKLQLPYVFRTPRVCSKVDRHYSKSYSCFMGVVLDSFQIIKEFIAFAYSKKASKQYIHGCLNEFSAT